MIGEFKLTKHLREQDFEGDLGSVEVKPQEVNINIVKKRRKPLLKKNKFSKPQPLEAEKGLDL